MFEIDGKKRKKIIIENVWKSSSSEDEDWKLSTSYNISDNGMGKKDVFENGIEETESVSVKKSKIDFVSTLCRHWNGIAKTCRLWRNRENNGQVIISYRSSRLFHDKKKLTFEKPFDV